MIKFGISMSLLCTSGRSQVSVKIRISYGCVSSSSTLCISSFGQRLSIFKHIILNSLFISSNIENAKDESVLELLSADEPVLR
jgi:hypothetical protein